MSALPRFRIFISSPRDVGSERALAMRAIERLQLEFRGRVELEPIFWENEVLKATDTFQSQIPRASETDLCVFILWSWFGTPLPESFRRPDGTTYRSGTEFEFEDAISGFRARGTPDILVYRKTADVAIPTRDRKLELEWRGQRDALFDFVDHWFRGEGGSFKAAFHEFDKQQQFEDVFETHLRRWIERRLRAAPSADAKVEAASGGIWRGSPYRGLERFDFDHALIYCGRTQAVAEAIDALRRLSEKGTPFLLVAGMSGAGKSSFVRAGVLPMLIQPRVIEGDIAWRWAALRPGDVAEAPLESVAAALLSETALPELADGVARAELAAMLAERTEAVIPMLSLALARAASTRQPQPAASARLVLIVDQLDEIFTQAAVTPQARNAFAQALAALARSGKVWVIMTLRSDLFSRIAELPAAFCDLARGDGFYELRPPSPAEIGQMIRRPARVAGVSFERRADTEEALDDVLRDAAAAQPASLPLLQFALDELSKACADTKLLTFAAYDKLGGLEGALRARAEATFGGLGELAKAALSPVIARLVQVRLDGDVGQTRAPKAALDAIPGGGELVDAFVGARLFVLDRGGDGEAVVGVAHEALLREWPRVHDWIEANRAFLNVRARIAAAQALWSAAEHGDAHLLPAGRLLQEGEGLLNERRELLSDADADFIAASLRRAARARRGRTLRTAAAAVLALLVAGGGVAWWDAYLRDHVSNFRHFSKRWGVFEGQDALSEEEAAGRSNVYRVHRRGRLGPVYRVEMVNGYGVCPTSTPLALYIGGDRSVWNFTSKRVCAMEFESDGNGRARTEQGFDYMDRLVYTFRYSDKDGTTAEYYTAEGYASSGAGSGASRVVFERIPSGPLAGLDTAMFFKDAYGRPKQNHHRVYGMRYDYNAQGRVVRFTRLGRDGQPMAASDGTVIEQVEYDQNGETVSSGHLDAAGQPTPAQAGHGLVKIARDRFGNDTSYLTVGLDGQPFVRSEGYAEVRYRYGKRGNIETIEYFDAAGGPTHSRGGVSRARWTSDEHGWLTQVEYFDENDQPVLAAAGVIKERYSYDGEANRVRVEYFDAKGVLYAQTVKSFEDGYPTREAYLDGEGRPVVQALGYSAIRFVYRNGLEAERTYVDGADRPVVTTRKFSRQVTRYDERNNPTELAYFDADGKPALYDGAYHRLKRLFNDFGNPEEDVYLGTDGAPVTLAAGYAKIRTRHDEHGRAVEVKHFTADERPIWPANDCSYARTYDGFGRETSTTCLRDGRPAPHPAGWSRKAIAYDGVGNAQRETYTYEGAAPADKPRLGRIERAHSPWGKLIREAFFDEAGAPLVGAEGCHRIEQQYSRNGSLIEKTCFDADGAPAESRNTGHRMVVAYDDRGRVLHRTYTMLRPWAGWPTRTVREWRDAQERTWRAEFLDDNGVVRQRNERDEKGRIVQTEYFDGDGRPALGPGGFAKSRVLAFDDFGGSDMVFEDEQGKPVEPAILVRGVKEGGAGARAGLRVDDVILRYGGRDIHYGTLAAAQRAPGDGPRELGVRRAGAPVTLSVERGPLQIEIAPVPRPKQAGG